MSNNFDMKKSRIFHEEIHDMKATSGRSTPSRATTAGSDPRLSGLRRSSSQATSSPLKTTALAAMNSPSKSSTPQSPAVKSENEDVVGGEITVEAEPGQPPKLARSNSKKIPSRPAKLFFDCPDDTETACKIFERIDSCIYANKYIGTTEHALECDCSEQWDSTADVNHACGEGSDCINRWTKLECISDCACGTACQNRRFQRRSYANVTVIKTDKKGYGLRANTDLRANEFIFEYIGEVIGENSFRRRMAQYDKEGQKHFYFMSLTKGEFVDATKKGNLGRFCNHSCNPNCYVDKWVVGDRLRMGIFAGRNITAGEELVFNYNVDRYGANPQVCYCGELNCTGYIGGKTQTERGTKLSAITIEALGIEDGDDWDIAVAKKGRKKKASGEADEEYVDGVQPKSLDESAVTKVMATLMQCKEKWIAVKLLRRIQESDDEKVTNRVVRMHGYRILKSALNNFIDDCNVVLQVLDILHRLPRLTRNKIQDSKIEDTVEKLRKNEDDRVKEQTESILKIWSVLEVGYRIPRMKRDPNAVIVEDRRRRSRSRSRSRTRSVSPPRAVVAPSGPRNGLPQRPNFFPGPRPPPFRRPIPPKLPSGWFEARSGDGKIYYYSADGQTTWQRPNLPAQAPPPPPKTKTEGDKLMDIIEGIVNKASVAKPKDPSAMASPTASHASKPKERDAKKEKWRSYDETKTKKMYENTLFPHVQHVMNKYKSKLPRDDLKRFAKECAKFLVAQDYKKGRIEDPTKLSEKQERQVKKYVQSFFDKAVAKRSERDKHKVGKEAKSAAQTEKSQPEAAKTPHTPATAQSPFEKSTEPVPGPQEDVVLSDNEVDDDDGNGSSQISPDADGDLKRKREAYETPLTGISPQEDEGTPHKMMRSETPPTAPPPPPPPPPPAVFSPGEDEDAIAEVDMIDASPEDDQILQHESQAKFLSGSMLRHTFTPPGSPPPFGIDSNSIAREEQMQDV